MRPGDCIVSVHNNSLVPMIVCEICDDPMRFHENERDFREDNFARNNSAPRIIAKPDTHTYVRTYRGCKKVSQNSLISVVWSEIMKLPSQGRF
jgi:hypothetical protein